MLRLGAGLARGCACGKRHAFQAGRRRFEGAVERFDLGPAVEGDDVDQVDGPTVEACPGRGRAVGDALHLFEKFLVEAAEKQGVDQPARVLPALRRGFGR